jgi:hypothetical protein
MGWQIGLHLPFTDGHGASFPTRWILSNVAVKPRPSGRGYKAGVVGLFPGICFLFAW